MDKEYLQKSSANITLSNERLNVLPQKMKKKITLFDIALDILDSVIGGKGTVGQEEVKLLIFANPVIRSDQISHSVVSDSLRPHASQHARPPWPSPTPRVHSDSRPSSQ